MPTFETSLELPIEVEYDYTPACRGSRERGTGLQLEPDEDAYTEVTTVTLISPALNVEWTGRKDFDALAQLIREMRLPESAEDRERIFQAAICIEHIKSSKMHVVIDLEKLDESDRERLTDEAADDDAAAEVKWEAEQDRYF